MKDATGWHDAGEVFETESDLGDAVEVLEAPKKQKAEKDPEPVREPEPEAVAEPEPAAEPEKEPEAEPVEKSAPARTRSTTRRKVSADK